MTIKDWIVIVFIVVAAFAAIYAMRPKPPRDFKRPDRHIIGGEDDGHKN